MNAQTTELISESNKPKPVDQKQPARVRVEKTAHKMNKHTNNRRTAMPQEKDRVAPLFKVTDGGKPDPRKLTKYESHLILNHASPDELTRLARNPKLKIPELDKIATTRHDMTIQLCLEYKLKRAKHNRKQKILIFYSFLNFKLARFPTLHFFLGGGGHLNFKTFWFVKYRKLWLT